MMKKQSGKTRSNLRRTLSLVCVLVLVFSLFGNAFGGVFNARAVGENDEQTESAAQALAEPEGEEAKKTGIVEENGAYYYYDAEGNIVANGEVVVEAGNAYNLTAGTYTTDENGKLSDEPKPQEIETTPPTTEPKTGLFEEEGVLYYYVNGEKGAAGLVKVDDAWYHVEEGGAVQTSGTYVLDADHEDLKAGTYTVGSDGKLTLQEPEKKTGIVEEDGAKYYYNDDGVKQTAAGFVTVENTTYYVQDGGAIKTKVGFIKVDGAIYYVEDGGAVRTQVGLFTVNDTRYYVKDASGALFVNDKKAFDEKQDGLSAGTYFFDENGALKYRVLVDSDVVSLAVVDPSTDNTWADKRTVKMETKTGDTFAFYLSTKEDLKAEELDKETLPEYTFEMKNVTTEEAKAADPDTEIFEAEVTHYGKYFVYAVQMVDGAKQLQCATATIAVANVAAEADRPTLTVAAVNSAWMALDTHASITIANDPNSKFTDLKAACGENELAVQDKKFVADEQGENTYTATATDPESGSVISGSAVITRYTLAGFIEEQILGGSNDLTIDPAVAPVGSDVTLSYNFETKLDGPLGLEWDYAFVPASEASGVSAYDHVNTEAWQAKLQSRKTTTLEKVALEQGDAYVAVAVENTKGLVLKSSAKTLVVYKTPTVTIACDTADTGWEKTKTVSIKVEGGENFDNYKVMVSVDGAEYEATDPASFTLACEKYVASAKVTARAVTNINGTEVASEPSNELSVKQYGGPEQDLKVSEANGFDKSNVSEWTNKVTINAETTAAEGETYGVYVCIQQFPLTDVERIKQYGTVAESSDGAKFTCQPLLNNIDENAQMKFYVYLINDSRGTTPIEKEITVYHVDAVGPTFEILSVEPEIKTNRIGLGNYSVVFTWKIKVTDAGGGVDKIVIKNKKTFYPNPVAKPTSDPDVYEVTYRIDNINLISVAFAGLTLADVISQGYDPQNFFYSVTDKAGNEIGTDAPPKPYIHPTVQPKIKITKELDNEHYASSKTIEFEVEPVDCTVYIGKGGQDYEKLTGTDGKYTYTFDKDNYHEDGDYYIDARLSMIDAAVEKIELQMMDLQSPYFVDEVGNELNNDEESSIYVNAQGKDPEGNDVYAIFRGTDNEIGVGRLEYTVNGGEAQTVDASEADIITVEDKTYMQFSILHTDTASADYVAKLFDATEDGNESNYQFTVHVQYDGHAPQADSITLDALNQFPCGSFKAGDVNMTLQVSDSNETDAEKGEVISDVSSVWVTYDGLEAPIPCELKDGVATYTFPAGEIYKNVRVIVVDNAGNSKTTDIRDIAEDATTSNYIYTVDAKPTADSLVVNSDTNVYGGNDNGEGRYFGETEITITGSASDEVVGLQSLIVEDVEGMPWSKDDEGKVFGGGGKTFTDETDITRNATVEYRANTADASEGEHTVELVATNNLNNHSEEPRTVTFIIDKTAPVIGKFSFQPISGSTDKDNDDGTFADDPESPFVLTPYGFFFKDDATVTVEVKDDYAGVKVVQYRLVDVNGNVVASGDATLDGSAATFPVKRDFKGQIFVNATDNVNNSTTDKRPTLWTIAETADTHKSLSRISWTPSTAPYKTKDNVDLFNQNVAVTIHYVSPYAGIDKNATEVELLVNGANVAVNGTWKDTATDRNLVTAADYSFTVSNESNDIVINTTLVDNAGNSSKSQRVFAIDKTPVAVSVKYDNDNAQNGKYFKDNRTATVTVSDWNFDTCTIETEGRVSGFTEVAPVDGIPTYQATIVYDTDGDYTLHMSATDLAGHNTPDSSVVYNGVATQEFTVDKTAPIITGSFDNNNVRNGKYFNASRTATIVIEEHNFSYTTEGYSPIVTMTANIAEGSTSVPGVNGWSVGSDQHTATITFTQDGDYTLQVDYTDLAGNPAVAPWKADDFTVDTTPPTLEITGVEDHHAYKGEVSPSIVYHDINFDPNSPGITITGVKHPNASNMNGTTSNDAYGGSFTALNIQVLKANDDVYTIVGSITDLAGNTTEQTLTFSVNRFGSTYAFDQPTEQLLDEYYSNAPQDVVIREINVDRVVSHTITVSVNGQTRTLVEGQDYTVTEHSDGWMEYVYTIKASVFDQEGPYDIVVTSEDEAGNTNTNRTVKADGGVVEGVPVNFVLDKTAPNILFDNVKHRARYIASSREIYVRYDDNVAVTSVEVFNNDELVARYEAEDLAEFENGEIPLTVSASNEWQDMVAVAYDAAGNESGEANVRFLLTSNVFVQFINSLWAILIALVVIAAIIFFIVKRRRDDAKNQETA